MDFPVCPSCGQSVIDDDAADCPFCGSSMKAKPGSKPAAKPAAVKAPVAAAKTPAAAGVASKPTAAKPAAGKAGPADDFPFETEVPGAKTAIQAMPSQSKGRTLEVTCPMCETKGFLPPSAAGKDVKCANPNCMVPVFKAPAAKVEAAPPPPPPKKSNMMMVGGITVVLMAVIGGIAVFVSSQPSGSTSAKKELSPEDLELLKGNPTSTPVKPDPDKPNPQPSDGSNKKSVDPVVATADTLIADALKQLKEASLKRDNRQRSKPYCRQMAADACIRAGDMKDANEHLAQIIIVGSPTYRIEPNLELFWKAWTAGDKAAATKILDTSMEDVKKLPEVGHNQMEVASRLAAALAAAGRNKEGMDLLADHQSSELEGQLAAKIQIASDGRVAPLSNDNSVLPWLRPQAVATTASLAARGQLDAARQWALAQANDDTRIECLSMWAQNVAERQAKDGAADANADIVDAAKALKPVLAARIWARAAFGRLAASDQAGATATLKLAQDLLASITMPAEPEMPSLKAMLTYKVPEATPLVHGATAAAEVAFVQSQIADQQSQAEASLEQALTFARGLAPAWSAVGEKVTQAEQAGQGLRDIIKKELAIKSDDQANQSAIRYRTVLGEINSASQRRYSLQLTILSRLAEVGLRDKVWSVVSNRSAESNPSRRDDFFGTNLIAELLEQFEGSETKKVILGAIGGTAPQGYVSVKQLLQPNRSQESAAYVNQLDANSGYRDDVALTVATRLAALDRGIDAMLFISKLDDIVLREEAYRLVAPIITQKGHAADVWKQVGAVQQATEKASLCRGLVVGLKSGPQKQ